MNFNNLEKFRAKIKAGQTCIGTIISFTDPAVSECLADAGFDFLWIDTEHCALGLETTLHHVMAHRGTNTAPFIRVPWNDPVLIKPILEFEPAGIVIPMVNTAEEAENAVKACRYPPVGIRGYGPRRGVRFGEVSAPDYVAEASNQPLVIIQIEHIEGVRNLDAILKTPGLDSICIGPNDLSGSMGMLGQVEHPDVVSAIDTICEKTVQAGLLLGVSTGYHPEKIRTWLNRGLHWIGLNTDYVNMRIQSVKILDEVRSIVR
jgi:2-keto-3-deoxy-L-rhamnonate aldolase RhmA